jgi:ArsR family transcriptional regulator, arsenate/arsenite/antimonite-responsive transcriptional repressor
LLLYVSIIGNFASIVKRNPEKITKIIDKVSEHCNNKSMKESDQKRLRMTADLFKAVGHPDRLAMLEKLAERPWCVCDLAAYLKLNKSVASKHLSILYDAGLLGLEKKGTQVIYTLVVPCIVEMEKCSYLAIVDEKRKRLET